MSRPKGIVYLIAFIAVLVSGILLNVYFSRIPLSTEPPTARELAEIRASLPKHPAPPSIPSNADDTPVSQ